MNGPKKTRFRKRVGLRLLSALVPSCLTASDLVNGIKHKGTKAQRHKDTREGNLLGLNGRKKTRFRKRVGLRLLSALVPLCLILTSYD
jgi:hypothetical protein